VRGYIVAAISGIPWMDNASRSDLLNEALGLYKLISQLPPRAVPRAIAFGIDGVMKALNRAYRRTWVRTRKTAIESGLKLHRAMEEPIVFYVVSSHQKPQKAHEPLQGKLLVDRYWKSTLEAVGGDVKAVGRFIRNRHIKTVQWAMGEPHWLLTRPNCKHFLIPVRTDVAMSDTAKALSNMSRRASRGTHRPLSDHERWMQYCEMRSAVLSSCRKIIKTQDG